MIKNQARTRVSMGVTHPISPPHPARHHIAIDKEKFVLTWRSAVVGKGEEGGGGGGGEAIVTMGMGRDKEGRIRRQGPASADRHGKVSGIG